MIFTADTHLSEACPISRSDKDEWLNVQMDKLEQMVQYGIKNEHHDIIFAGDFFHKFSDTTTLVNLVMGFFTKYRNIRFYIIYGNHDLKNHNKEFNLQTSLLTIGYLPNVTVVTEYRSIDIEGKQVDFFGFGQKLCDKGGDIAVIHKFAYKNKPWHDAPEAGNFKNVADQLEQYELIVCGDNHERFIANYEGQVFLNCGSMTRRKIDQRDFEPHFYAMTGWKIHSIPFEINEDVWDPKKGNVEKLKDGAMKEVAKKFDSHVVVDLDFEDNLDKYCDQNNIEDEYYDFIIENMEEKKK
jgi:DNA repair exonuclease SbcCD nuclease subunit